MDSTHGSQSPDNADKNLSFPKSSNDKPNRKYRRHSTISRSVSPSSDGSPRHVRSPSPAFSREDHTKISDVPLRQRNGGKELDMESGRSRFDKGGDSFRHSDRRAYRSSSDHHRHGDYNRYHKRADEGERSYHRSSGSGRESRSGGTYSDRTRHGSEHDRLGDYRRSTDKYAQEKSGDGHRRNDEDRDDRKKHKDKESTIDKDTSGRRHVNLCMDDSVSDERERHNRDGGSRDDKRNYGKSLGDRKNDTTVSAEEAMGRGRHSNAGPESGGSRMKETRKTNIKDLGQQKGDTMEKRKHSDREYDRYRDGFSKESSGKDNGKDNESSPKKSKVFNAESDRNNGKDDQIPSKPTILLEERPPSRPKLPQETIDKVISESAQSSNKAEGSHDFDAAKVAAMKAAELVNRNLIPGGYMSTDQKKKLLWGSKKTTVAEESSHHWDVPLFSDQERQEKFKKLMGVKGDLKPGHKPDNKESSGLLQAEKQEQLQLDLEKQYTAGLRRRDGRTVGLGL
ncbi:pre-mRNA-splicing factor [Thalictrum thalictroides]|uniref:Pre-mRNA-splicing factor n=1 Tax=Thalictrum thalictroides TaxID=46969 RepID=A0A7J6VL14_THATH|nr:pre-mRNA-splicing factor [Thalictrum thalictroides]